MSTHPGASFAWSLRNTASSVSCNTILKDTKTHLCIDGCRMMDNVHHELHRAHCELVLFRVLCAVRTRLWSQWWFYCTLLFVLLIAQLFALRASNHWKHGYCKKWMVGRPDMGAFLFLNAETLKRVPTPLFGRLVRCSANWPSFARLRGYLYM